MHAAGIINDAEPELAIFRLDETITRLPGKSCSPRLTVDSTSKRKPIHGPNHEMHRTKAILGQLIDNRSRGVCNPLTERGILLREHLGLCEFSRLARRRSV